MTAQHPSTSYDPVIADIADYVCRPERAESALALATAHLTVVDALGCAFLGLADPTCRSVAEPLFPAPVAHAARIPGTRWTADPVQAAFATGVAIRWLDFNDTWLALEWGHPVDNLGGLLPVADHVSQRRRAAGAAPLSVRDLLVAEIQAHEIQGVLALGTALNRNGLDHVAYVRVATAAVATRLLGGDRDAVAAAVSHAFADGGALRAYRHAPNVTQRKSWAAGDATARGVWLALRACRGEPGLPEVLSTPTWGYGDALLGGHRITLPQPLGTYIMENVLLKPWFPAEYHAQTAVEAGFALHPAVADRLDDVTRVEVRTHESAIRIIDKKGPLANFADRDHCLQYMLAVALIKGSLSEADYHDDAAADPRIDRLRDVTEVSEDTGYSRAYLDPAERAVANAVRVHFADGTDTGWAEIRIPIGHPRRRDEARPLVYAKLRRGAASIFEPADAARLTDLVSDVDSVVAMAVDDFAAALTAGGIR